MKNKTLAVWLALLAGPLGLHRFYLFGWGDLLGWLMPLPASLGLYGIQRFLSNGPDDPATWFLLPLLGFTFAGCALNAIVYGLMQVERWNARFNPDAPLDASAGRTGWLTIGAVAISLLVGAAVLIASIAFSFQHYFEYQIESARQLS